MITRRRFTAFAALSVSGTAERGGRPATADAAAQAHLLERLRDIERESRGRVGVSIADASNRFMFGYRPDERFPMCSTFKLLACAFVLQRADRGRESLDRRVRYTAADLVPYSPVTDRHVGGAGMTLGELCEATMTTSDNTAANLILASYGGPRRLTAFARAIGDPVTRLDRTEPTLNEARPGDPRDTTSPRAMVDTLHKVVLGGVLSAASRATMQRWLRANTTGDHRLKAGLPADWTIGDKTGTSGTGTTNDIAVIWPPGRAPLLVTAYITQSPLPAPALDTLVARVGGLLPTLLEDTGRRPS